VFDTESDTIKVDRLNDLAYEYGFHDYEQGIYYAEKAHELATSIDYLNGIFTALTYSGRLYHDKGNYSQSFVLYEEAFEIAQKTENRIWLSRAHNGLSVNYVSIGDFKNASDHVFESLNLIDSSDNRQISITLNLIGYLYFHQKNFDKALEYYSRALKIVLQLENESSIAAGYNNVAAIYDEKRNYDKAISYYLKALEINRRLGDKQFLSINLSNIGASYKNLDQLEKSKEYYFQGLTIAKELNDKYLISSTLLDIGNLFFEIDSLEGALLYSEQSFILSSEIGSPVLISGSSELLYMIYLKKKNYSRAFEYHVLFKQMEDSVFNTERISHTTRLELRHKFDIIQKEKERQFHLQQLEQELIHEQTVLRYIFLVGGLIMIIIIIILLFINQKSRLARLKLKKRHLDDQILIKNQELDIKDKELATNVMYLVKRNELIATIGEKLGKASEKMPQENNQVLSGIVHELKTGLKDNIWKEFEIRFENVHTEFYKNLNERYPNLTPNEKKLCAFLRLNMTTKDIASITHQSVNSIRIARTRLRKNLELTNEDINLVTFLSRF